MEAKNKDDKMKLSEIMKLNNVFFDFIKYFINLTI